jgi:hypothetical protein
VAECGVSYEEVADLTDAQISGLLGIKTDQGDKGRDENSDGDGRLVNKKGWHIQTVDTFREQYKRVWSSRGKPAEWIEQRWKAEHPNWAWKA